MRNLMGSTKYAPVSNTGEDANNEVDNIRNSTKNTIISGQVSRLVDGIFPNAPNMGGNNMNLSSPMESLSNKSAALKSAFKSSTNLSSPNSNYPPNILNHPNITTLIPGIGGYQYEAVDKQSTSGPNSTNETVEAKWEQLQYYESSQWQNARTSPTNTEGAFSSIASSGASSTASSSSSSKTEGSGSSMGSSLSIPKTNGTIDLSGTYNDENLAPPTFIPPPPASHSSSARKKFQDIKRQSLKKLNGWKNHLTGNNSSSGTSKFKSTSSTNMNSRAMSSYGVSTAPGGGSNNLESDKRGGGMLSRIRASKSMQNLDQITRDSYFNIRDKTTNLKAIYSSRIELRAEKPSSQYDELSDEDEDDNYKSGKLEAASDSDSDSGVGHTYDNLRKANGRRMLNPIHTRFGRVGH